MANNPSERHETVGAWAKRYYFANREAMESVLRPYDVGSTQWYVLYQLANHGPTSQRDLGPILRIERATLSGVVAALVRKGLVKQGTPAADQRQRVLELTDAGRHVWSTLPDPIAVLQAVAFDGADPGEVATTLRVLQDATRRVAEHMAAAEKA